MTAGALLIAGTSSDAGKSLLVTALCRSLARRGVRVAPFKAQNMALNAAVTADGAEIGRAQALQAAACGLEPTAVMNPVLLKPGGGGRTQVVVRGRVAGCDDAVGYQARREALRAVALDALAELRDRVDAVICEGAGSPAEINLRAGDIANLGLARAAGLSTLVVGDIDRGGVFASLYGTLALLEPADQALVAGFVINKFRGDPAVLAPGLAQLQALTGRPVLGVLPWLDAAAVDAEDSLALDGYADAAAVAADAALRVALVRLPYTSNFTDLDPLRAEPHVAVVVTTDPAVVRDCDLAVVPGTKATVEDLAWLRARGLDDALAARAAVGAPVLGICGGQQLLGTTIHDDVESGAGTVAGLGLLPVTTTFAADKHLARVTGTAPRFGDVRCGGYEIHHGRTRAHGGDAWLVADDGSVGGWAAGAVLGASWHGLLEHDELRQALLAWVAGVRGRTLPAAGTRFAEVRLRWLDALADAVDAHLDLAAVDRLLADGAPAGLPTLPPAGGAPSEPTPPVEAAP